MHILQPAEWKKPRGFSHGVVVEGPGRWVVLAGPVLMAVAISFLEIFVAFLQAYIFAMLTSVFIGLARHAH